MSRIYKVFCVYLGNDLFSVFDSLTTQRGDKSRVVAMLINEFLEGKYSVYELLDFEDRFTSNQRRNHSFLDKKTVHFNGDKEMLAKFADKCKRYGVSNWIILRALILEFVKPYLVTVSP